MFAQVIFARFGRENRLSEQNATERQKTGDWLAEKIGFELAVEFPQHAFQACSDSKSRIMAAKSASAGLNNRDRPRGGMAEKVESRRVGLGCLAFKACT